MADKRLTRRQKTDKAFQSLVVAGGSGVGAIVAFVVGAGFIGFVLLVIAVLAGFTFKKTVN